MPSLQEGLEQLLLMRVRQLEHTISSLSRVWAVRVGHHPVNDNVLSGQSEPVQQSPTLLLKFKSDKKI